MEGPIFALDIGTRSIVGLVGRREGKKVSVVAAQVIEHDTRAMLDGQIHDVEKVAQEVEQVKIGLERQTGIDLEEVAVAVAGRALKTKHGHAEIDAPQREEIGPETIRNLDFMAVQKALSALESEREAEDPTFQCVGYTPVYYELDGGRIGSLLGQRGSKAQVEVIATFLPRVVVDSMYAAVKRAGLSVGSLTLEPIAALNVVAPKDVRILNLALIDIGAGTSDIALTRDGTVIAYAMLPVAGDELTEKICKKYLLDFAMGERVKRSLLKEEVIRFEDIMGSKYEMPAQQLIDELADEIKSYADEVSTLIEELNGGPPDAAICVGGGSQIPLLTGMLSTKMNLPKNRAAIKGVETISRVVDETGCLKGPDFITPVGILVWAFEQESYKFINVGVNDVSVSLLKTNHEVKVSDALIASGLEADRLYGQAGMDLAFEVDGNPKVIKGGEGKDGSITVNGQEATLATPLKEEDVVVVKEADIGQDASISVEQIIKSLEPVGVNVNGTPLALEPMVIMNGSYVGPETVITQHAKIEVENKGSVKDALGAGGVSLSSLGEEEITLTVNNQDRYFTVRNYQLTVNDQSAELNAYVGEGDRVELKKYDRNHYRIKDIIDLPPDGSPMTVTINGERIEVGGGGSRITMDGQPVSAEEPVLSGAVIKVVQDADQPFILSNIFNYYQGLSLDDAQGKHLSISVNGQKAGFTTPLMDGDKVEIEFV